jgi:hypothetical protein
MSRDPELVWCPFHEDVFSVERYDNDKQVFVLACTCEMTPNLTVHRIVEDDDYARKAAMYNAAGDAFLWASVLGLFMLIFVFGLMLWAIG